MKTTTKILKYAFLVVFVVMASCSAEDGEDGAVGPQGPAGMDGIDGTNGQDGTDGQDGQDGTDGNANVQNYTFDISDVSGSFYSESVPQLTEDVLTNDLIYAFVHTGTLTYSIPNMVNPDGTTFFIRTFMQPGSFDMRFQLASDNSNYNMPAGTLEQLRIVVVEATGTRTPAQMEQLLLSQGVNVSQYESLKAHFDL